MQSPAPSVQLYFSKELWVWVSFCPEQGSLPHMAHCWAPLFCCGEGVMARGHVSVLNVPALSLAHASLPNSRD